MNSKNIKSFIIPLFIILLLSGCSKSTSNLNFSVNFEDNSKHETPLIIKMEGLSENNKNINKAIIVKKDAFKTKIKNGQYKITYISPIDKDGSIYNISGIDNITVDPKNDNKISLTATKTNSENVSYNDIKEIYESISNVLNNDKKHINIIDKSKEIYKSKYEACEKEVQLIMNWYMDKIINTYFDNASNAEYAFIPSISENKVPTLLIKQNSDSGESLQHISFYDYSSNTDLKDSIIYIGVSPVGGFRGGLQLSNDKLEYTTLLSGTGYMEKYILEIKDNNLYTNPTWDGNISDYTIDDDKNTEDINWKSIIDIKDIMSNLNIPEDMIAKYCENYKNMLINASDGTEYKVYRGTAHIIEGDEELCKFMNIKNPNPDIYFYSSYAFVMLDKKEAITASTFEDKKVSRDMDYILLYSYVNYKKDGYPQILENIKNINNQKVSIIRKDGSGYWPSDTSLPLGAARGGSFFVIKD